MSCRHQPPIRSRFHAWCLGRTEKLMHRVYGERKRKLFASLPASIVEIGAGTGLNLRYYEAGSSVIAIEPNLRMHRRLAQNARMRGISIDIRGLRGEELDLETGSADVVICTLVLCSVDDPERTVSEIRRVLKPGGRYLFLEHVAAPQGTPLRTWQNLAQRPWSWCFDGCRPNRETASTLETAGFASLELERFRMPTGLAHVSPHISGVAIN